MVSLCRRVEDACAAVGRWVGWLVLLLIVVVCAGVVAAKLRVNMLIDWGVALPLLGNGVSINTLQDLQWHLFTLLVLFGGSYTFRENGHVSVDFVSLTLPVRVRKMIQVAGHLLFLLPFCAITVWFAWKFTLTAYRGDEGSPYGGLADWWLIKGSLPLAFTLLGVAGLARTVRAVADLCGVPGAADPSAFIRSQEDATP